MAMSERSPYRFRGPETWAAAREAYIAGETAASIAARLGVTVGALRQRAARGGWSRRALAAAAEAPLARIAAARPPAPPGEAPTPAAEPDAPPPAVGEVLDAALSRAAHCLQAGRADEALRAIALGERLAALAQSAARLRPKTLDEARAANAELREAIEEVAQAARPRRPHRPRDRPRTPAPLGARVAGGAWGREGGSRRLR